MSGIVLSEVPPSAGETVEEISVPVMESAFVRVKAEPQQQQQQQHQTYDDEELPLPRIAAGTGKKEPRSCIEEVHCGTFQFLLSPLHLQLLSKETTQGYIQK